MTWPATVLFSLLAAALAGSIAWQFMPAQVADEAQPRVPVQASAGLPGPAVLPGQPADLAATLLARPLMTPTRRPRPPPAQASTPATGLPRLTGVIISPDGRSAIFAGRPRALVIPEGGQVGEYTVQQITPGLVTLNGPAGPVALRPSFDAARPAAPVLLGLPLAPEPPGDAAAAQDAPSALPFERQTTPSGLDILRNLNRPPASIR